jgi:hypothetical protein
MTSSGSSVATSTANPNDSEKQGGGSSSWLSSLLDKIDSLKDWALGLFGSPSKGRNDNSRSASLDYLASSFV